MAEEAGRRGTMGERGVTQKEELGPKTRAFEGPEEVEEVVSGPSKQRHRCTKRRRLCSYHGRKSRNLAKSCRITPAVPTGSDVFCER